MNRADPSESGRAAFWNLPLHEIASELARDLDKISQGLANDEAGQRLARFGTNDAVVGTRTPLVLQLAARFRNPLILILLAASALSALSGEVTSFIIIFAVVLLGVGLDFLQEVRAERTAAALREQVTVRARVLRDGAEIFVPASELVPGDVVLVRAGDRIPADGRLLQARDFFVNQALLTGEPYPIEKHARDLATKVQHPGAADNAVFMGSSVISGTATVIIVHTGHKTALGALSSSLATKAPPTDFERGTRQFGMLILRITILLVLCVILFNAALHRPWLEALLFALALAVGLTPELLPMVSTVTLARGALRLASRRVIVKRLAAMHNLGAMDLLCTDKTGTLTEAKIRLVRHLDIRGEDSERVFELAYLNSYFETGMKSPLDEAILEHRTLDVARWRKLDEVPFDFERRRVSVLATNGDRRWLIMKGAPEDILRRCDRYLTPGEEAAPLDEALRAEILQRIAQLGDDGYRTLGIAWHDALPEQTTATRSDESQLILAGFAAFIDPPKAGVAEALEKLTQSGIDIRIVSGDSDRVTRHLCQQVNLPVRGVLTGEELAALSDEALQARLRDTNLFCRVTPQQKLRILLALKHQGRVVGFLGDGLNDAPALHAADVGISVDSATDVAKDAADIILLERQLSVIYDGVREGRRTFANVLKYVLMATSSNFGNMLSMACAALFLPFLPMRPVQVLLNNLLYDLSEIGIPFDRVDPVSMQHPRHWDARLVRRFMLIFGPLSSLFDLATFVLLLRFFHASAATFQTAWFVESLASQALVIFIVRTSVAVYKSRPHPALAALSIGAVVLAVALPLSPFGALFGFVKLPPLMLAALAGMVFSYLLVAELVKRLFFLKAITSAAAPQ